MIATVFCCFLLFFFVDVVVVENKALFSRNNYTNLSTHKLHIYVSTHYNLHTMIQSKQYIELIYSTLLAALSAMQLHTLFTLIIINVS